MTLIEGNRRVLKARKYDNDNQLSIRQFRTETIEPAKDIARQMFRTERL